MSRTRSYLKRAGAAPLVLAITSGLLLMQTSPQCVPEDLLSSQNATDPNVSNPEIPELESGRVLTTDELQHLIANANDQDIVVVFTNPIPGPQGESGPRGETGPAGEPGPAGAPGLTGEVRMWAGHPAHTPLGWLVCDGAAVSRTTFSELFAVIGTLYGNGDGSTTFNLPNYSNRSPMGANTWNSDGTPMTTVGGTAVSVGGAATHTLSESELPAHQHDMTHTHDVDVSTDITAGGTNDYLLAGIDNGGTLGVFPTASPSASNTAAAGGGAAHNNLHPYFAITYIICTGT